MVNLMREHVPSDARIHYVITNGGRAPNVVPDFAEAYYYARHNDMRVLEGIWERITNAARGAALGTGTTMELELTGAVWNVLPNSYLVGLMQQNLRKVGGYEYTPAERQFAEGIRKSLEGELARAHRAVDRRNLGTWHARAQLAGGRRRRHVDWRQGDDGCREGHGADGDGSVLGSRAHREGPRGVREATRAKL